MEVFTGESTNATKVVSLSDTGSEYGRNAGSYFIAAGVFGGATLTVTISAGGSARFAPLSNAVFTDIGAKIESLPSNCNLKCVITGATGTTDIDFNII